MRGSISSSSGTEAVRDRAGERPGGSHQGRPQPWISSPRYPYPRALHGGCGYGNFADAYVPFADAYSTLARRYGAIASSYGTLASPYGAFA